MHNITKNPLVYHVTIIGRKFENTIPAWANIPKS